MQDREVGTGTKLQNSLLSIILGAIIALGACCLMLLICSALVSAGIIPDGGMEKICTIVLALCALVGGRFTVKRGDAAPILLGAGCGLVICLLLIGISFLVCPNPGFGGNAVWMLMAALLGATLSSFAAKPKSGKGKVRKKR